MTARPSSTASALPTDTSRIERFVYGDGDAPPRVSVVIPTRDGIRRGLLDKLLEDLHEQTVTDFEVLLVIGDNRQGRAINRGVRQARASVIATMDDDTIIGTPRVLENLLEVLDANPDVGMVGASTVLPPGCTRFQKNASQQIPRRLFPIVNSLVDSDMVQHPCLAMPKSLFEAIGGEDEELVRGLDPLLRHKVRDAGYRVAIAPNTYVSHPLPEGLGAVLKMYFRNGRGSAFAQRNYPDRVYNLSDGHRKNQFPSRVPVMKRALAYPGRLLRSFLTGRWIRLGVEQAYLMGYAVEYFKPKKARS